MGWDCPKCKAKLSQYDGASKLSGLEGGSGQSAMYISGKSCIICGTWVEPPLPEPLKPMPVKTKMERKNGSVKGITSAEYGKLNLEKFRAYFDEFHRLKQKGFGISHIRNKLKIPISHCTVARCYDVICKEMGIEENLDSRRLTRADADIRNASARKVLAEESSFRKRNKLRGSSKDAAEVSA